MINFLDMAGSAVAGSILALWVTAHLARSLGVSGFGDLSVLRTVFDYAVMLVTFGLTVVGMREVAARPESTTETVFRVTGVRLAIAVVVSSGMLLASLITRNSHLQVGLRWLAPAVVLSALTVDWLYSARENVRLAATARLIGRIVYAGVAILAVRALVDFPIAVAAISAEALVLCVMVWVGFRWARPSWAAIFEPRRVAALLKESWSIGVGQLARQLKTNVDVFILAALGGSVAVGYYAAAYRLVIFVGMIAGLLATVLLPKVVRESQSDPARFARLIGRVVRVLLLGVTAIIGGGMLLAAPVVRLLFGEAFAPAGTVMVILIPATALILVSSVLTNVAIGVGRERVFLRAAIAAAAFNIMSNLLTVPLMGMYGSALSTVLTELLLTGILSYVLRDLGLFTGIGRLWSVRLAVVAVLQAVITFVLLQLGFGAVMATVASVAVFGSAAVLLRVVTMEDVRGFFSEL